MAKKTQLHLPLPYDHGYMYQDKIWKKDLCSGKMESDMFG